MLKRVHNEDEGKLYSFLPSNLFLDLDDQNNANQFNLNFRKVNQ